MDKIFFSHFFQVTFQKRKWSGNKIKTKIKKIKKLYLHINTVNSKESALTTSMGSFLVFSQPNMY